MRPIGSLTEATLAGPIGMRPIWLARETTPKNRDKEHSG
jgi:hypothetical protein